MIVLGIDPGTTSIGYAIIQWEKKKPRLLCADLLRLGGSRTSLQRTPCSSLLDVHISIKNIIAKWHPDILSIEKLFFAKNVKTALVVSETRGVILLTAALMHIIVSEYTPLEIKKVITSDGRADKSQIKKMLYLTLPETKSLPLTSRDDVYDAIAIALTYCFTQQNMYI